MAALAPVVEKLEDIPATAREFYVQKDGKYHVDLSAAPSGYVPAAELATANGRVVEFRDTNIALKKQVEELLPLKTQFEGLDPVAAKAAIAAQEELKKKGISKPDDITSIVDAAVKAANKPLIDQITSITTTAAEDKKRADAMTLRDTLSSRFSKAGGEPTALDFIVQRASGVFKVVAGVVVAEDNQFSTDKPGEKITVEEWMTKQTKDAAFAFKPSSGSGANPQPPGGGPARPAGQLVLTDPTPQQLGEHGDAIRKGKMRVEYTQK